MVRLLDASVYFVLNNVTNKKVMSSHMNLTQLSIDSNSATLLYTPVGITWSCKKYLQSETITSSTSSLLGFLIDSDLASATTLNFTTAENVVPQHEHWAYFCPQIALMIDEWTLAAWNGIYNGTVHNVDKYYWDTFTGCCNYYYMQKLASLLHMITMLIRG